MGGGKIVRRPEKNKTLPETTTPQRKRIDKAGDTTWNIGFLVDNSITMLPFRERFIRGWNDVMMMTLVRANEVNARDILLTTAFYHDSAFVSPAPEQTPILSYPTLRQKPDPTGVEFNLTPGGNRATWHNFEDLLNDMRRPKWNFQSNYRRPLVIVISSGPDHYGNENRLNVWKRVSKLTEEGWVFAYYGANQDSWAEAVQMGFHPLNTFNFHMDATGINSLFTYIAYHFGCFMKNMQHRHDKFCTGIGDEVPNPSNVEVANRKKEAAKHLPPLKSINLPKG